MSTSPGTSSNMPDPKKCVQVIRMLQEKVEEVKAEKNKWFQESNNLKEELSLIHKNYNKVLQEKESLLTTFKSDFKQSDQVPSSNDAMESLTAQNLALRNELTQLRNSEHVQDIVNINNLKQAIEHCKKTLSRKEEQIALLEQQNSQSELTTKVNKLQLLLKKTSVVNQSYSRHIETLQEQLNILSVRDTTRETQAKTVSGDQDLSALGHLDASGSEEEIQDLKAKIQSISEQLHDIMEKLESANTSKETLEVAIKYLEDENKALKKQNSMLTSSDFPVDSQMKAFQEDFNEERSEKEKQWKENQELKGENSSLKEKLNDLQTLIRRQSEERSQPQHAHPGMVRSPPVLQNQPSYEEQEYQGNMFTPTFPPTTPVNEPQRYSYPYEPTGGHPRHGAPMGYQANAGHGGYGQPFHQEATTKRIGFPTHGGPQAKPPRAISSHRQSVPPSSYQPSSLPQQNRAPPPRQPYRPQMSQPPSQYYNYHLQSSSEPYQPSTIQSDSAPQQMTDPMVKEKEYT